MIERFLINVTALAAVGYVLWMLVETLARHL